MIACSDKPTAVRPFKPYIFDFPYAAQITANGSVIPYKFMTSLVGDSTLVIVFDTYDDSGGYYYPITIKSALTTGTYSLNSQQFTLRYLQMCCLDSPDAIHKSYQPTADSLNNFIRLWVDVQNRKANGAFQATVVNETLPNDTVYLTCDTFVCEY